MGGREAAVDGEGGGAVVGGVGRVCWGVRLSHSTTFSCLASKKDGLLTQNDISVCSGLLDDVDVIQGAVNELGPGIRRGDRLPFVLVADQQSEAPVRVGLRQGVQPVATDVAGCSGAGGGLAGVL